MRRTRLTIAATLVASAGLVGIPGAAPAAAPADVPVQLLTINDFHGRISDTTGADATVGTTTVGGAANVASTVAATRQSFVAGGAPAENSLFIGLGDLVGASPFDSAGFRDESTVEVLNSLDMAVSVVGNHEFDRGTTELRRISGATDRQFSDNRTACQGVTAGVDGCFLDSTGQPFAGTDYPYLAANVVLAGTDTPMLPPYAIQEVGGQRIGFIGVVTETTAGIVAPTGIADVEFVDEADAINRYVPELQAQGVQAIVALVHEGGTPSTPADVNGCGQLSGSIVDINDRTDPAVDVVLSAHTHQNYSCYLTDPAGQPRLVAQSGYYGRLVGDVRFVIDGATGDVDRLCGTYSVTNVPTDRAARTPDAATASIVSYWAAQATANGSRTVGSTTTPLVRATNSAGSENRGAESNLGNTVAQAQLAGLQSGSTYADPAAAFGGRPAVAFMNPGGLRANIDAGPITYAEAFAVQPFGNYANAITLTGADIRLLLEQQFSTPGRTSQLWLGTSEGFRYTYDLSRPAYDRVDPASITIDDPTTPAVDPQAVVPTTRYRVVANSFLSGGGDSFTAFRNGTAQVTGPVDVDTAIAFFTANNPYTAPAIGHGVAVTDTRAANPATPPAGGGTGAGENGGNAVASGPTGTTGTAAAGYPCPTPPAEPGTPAPGAQPIAHPGNGIAAGQLANTGAATGQLTALGVGLLLAGGVATAAGYRRGRGLTE
ncbi:5'-nucleotidase [Klenkia soli]|uniref:5'-nucleotidase n=1 Tax=Klenkia soli TaxID=1052260 RepID=A0A1H0HUB8_9ACTN|nr:bifunctional metallophosphatase/5'-nucleotidase [Klenkia soli]SDO22805.1 5'-nucleotidase [Klenkia soli]